MKHKIKPTEIQWFKAYAGMATAKKGSRFVAQGREFRLVHVYGTEDDNPHPPSVELSEKGEGNRWQTYMCRRGDSLLCELQPRVTQ